MTLNELFSDFELSEDYRIHELPAFTLLRKFWNYLKRNGYINKEVED